LRRGEGAGIDQIGCFQSYIQGQYEEGFSSWKVPLYLFSALDRRMPITLHPISMPLDSNSICCFFSWLKIWSSLDLVLGTVNSRSQTMDAGAIRQMI